MSDTSQGENWWQASDGKWYAPEQHPDALSGAGAAATDAPSDTPADAPADAPGEVGPESAMSTPPDADAGADPTRLEPPQADPSSPTPGVTPEADPTLASPAATDPAPDAVPDPTTTMPAAPVDPTAAAPIAGSAATPPPTPPPTAPTPAPTGGNGGSGGGGKKVIVAIVAVVALAAAAFAVISLTGDDEAEAGEVVLESVGSTGADPYTEPVAEVDDAVSTFADDGPPEDAAPETDEGPAGYQSADGSVPGVFGGTLNESSCDIDQLTQFLAAEEAKAETWAEVVEIEPADIASFIDGLTPTNLSSDTRVLNHGFADGEVQPREAVLQRGTAVLVDGAGVPRVNCYSGNPLREPAVADGEEFAGEQWTSFEQTNIIVINEAPSTVDTFDLVELTSGELFSRPAGTTGEADVATRELADDGPIEFNTVISDQLLESRPEARYTLDAPDGAIMTLAAENQRDSISGVFFEFFSQGESFASFRLAPGGSDEAVVVLDHDGAAPFEVLVTEGPAAFSFEVQLEEQDDADTGADVPEELADSVLIEPGSYSGRLGGQDTADFYEVEVVPGSDLVLTVDNARESERAVFVQATLDESTFFSDRADPGNSTDTSLLLSGTSGGRVQLVFSEGASLYEFEIAFVPQEDSGAGDAGDAGDELPEATELSSTSEIQGEVGQNDPTDFYLFTPSGGTAEFSVAADAERAVLFEIQDSGGSFLTSFRVNAGATETETFEVGDAGQFRLVVSEGRGAYTGSIG